MKTQLDYGFQTRQEQTNSEWTANWEFCERMARRWVGKWIAVRGTNLTLDRSALVADTLDMAFEAYQAKFTDQQPRDIHKTLVQFIKLYARNAVRNAIADKSGIVLGDSLEDTVFLTMSDDVSREEWLDIILGLPDSHGREIALKVAIGKASGMFDREIAREVGISHTSVSRCLEFLRNLLRDYYLHWLLGKLERNELHFTPGQYFELLFTL